MYDAKIYKVHIGSSGIPMQETRIAFDTICLWNELHGEEMGAIYLPMSAHDTSTPDLHIFAIDNYVDSRSIESLIEQGSIVLLFFKKEHNPDNTIPGEVENVEAFRAHVQAKCICEDYNQLDDFSQVLSKVINDYMKSGRK